ncbi:hypothetical protein ACI65C_003362 [Semiaphis heraclei]
MSTFNIVVSRTPASTNHYPLKACLTGHQVSQIHASLLAGPEEAFSISIASTEIKFFETPTLPSAMLNTIVTVVQGGLRTKLATQKSKRIRNKQLCDGNIIVKHDEELLAHKFGLAANSEYFNVMLNGPLKNLKN